MEDPLLTLLYRLHENQNSLASAVEELAGWVVDRGSMNVGDAVEQHMLTIEANAEEISDALARLIAERAGRPKT